MSQLIPLHEFGFLAITGRDALKFFQGYTTCDVISLTESTAGLGATCNLQGRMVANYRILRHVDAEQPALLLRLHRSLTAPMINFLQKYTVFSKVKLADVSQVYECLGEISSDPAPALNAVAAAEDHYRICVDQAGPRFELWRRRIDDTHEADELQRQRWHLADIAAGHAWLDADNSERFLPQMLNLKHLGGISFTKGCYLGQEIVARMEYRGELKRRLYSGRADANATRGAVITGPDAQTVGEIVAAVDGHFLAVVQTGANLDGMRLADGAPVTLQAPAT